MLSSNADMLPPARRHELADAIEDEARYLVDMVENILALTRLEQYGFTLRMEAELVEDVVQEAVNIIRPRAGRRRLKTEFAAPLLLARMDARLTVQVLVNCWIMPSDIPRRILPSLSEPFPEERKSLSRLPMKVPASPRLTRNIFLKCFTQPLRERETADAAWA